VRYDAAKIGKTSPAREIAGEIRDAVSAFGTPSDDKSSTGWAYFSIDSSGVVNTNEVVFPMLPRSARAVLSLHAAIIVLRFPSPIVTPPEQIGPTEPHTVSPLLPRRRPGTDSRK